MPDEKNNGGGRMQSVNRGIVATNIGTQLAQGNFGWAAISAGITAAMNPKTYEVLAEAAVKLTKAVAPVAKAVGNVGKHIPVVGAVVTAGFVAYEVGTALAEGNKGKAAAALAAGATEMVVNGVGGGVFGASDIARQAVVEGIAAAGGARAQDAYLVSVGKRAVTVGSKFATSAVAAVSHPDPKAIYAQQERLIQGDTTLPDTVNLNGKQVQLDDALRNPTFAKSFRENLIKADHAGQIDSKPLIAKLDQFDKLEHQRTAAIAAANHGTTQHASTAHPTTLRPATQGMSA
ncbi:MAG: hypothetical protein ACAH80_17955 [Alphaproteobacteria bacterium]